MAIAGILPTLSGIISISRSPINRLNRTSGGVLGLATVAEGHYVLPGLNVRDNLAAAALALPNAEAAARIEDMFALFPELRERQFVGAHLLSGGQRQMVDSSRR